MTRVAVLGGGISGLAAAWWLRQLAPAVEVSLFESAPRLGGVIETLYDGDYIVEKGADNFATLLPDALELSKACGCDGDLIAPNADGRRAFVLCRGRLHPIPAGFSLMQPTRILSIATTGALSLRGKLRLLGEYFVPRRTDSGDESLEAFATRRLGREAFENLVEPIVSGIFTADPARLSMQATMAQFVQMEREQGGLIRGYLAARRQDAAAVARKASGARYDQFLAPRRGMESWLAAIAERLDGTTIHLDTPVIGLRAASGHPQRWTVTSERFQAQDFAGVVCGLPAAATAQLLQPDLPAAASLLAGIPYASSAVVAMIVNRRDVFGRVDGFGMICPSRAGRAALAISYSSQKYPGRVPDGELLLRVFMGGARNTRVLEQSDEHLAQLGLSEVREILDWRGEQPNWLRVIRWERAMPQYTLGHVQRMQELETIVGSHPTLQLCGAAYRGVGIPQCVRSGHQAATRLLAALRPSHP